MKNIDFKEEAREALIDGANILAEAVKVTFGPKGNNVIIDKGYNQVPLITNDGVSIAKEVILTDPLSNMGARIVREAASKTNNIAGDGTTGATILTQAIINKGYEEIKDNKANPILLRKGMNIALKDATCLLNELAIEIGNDKQLKEVATISAGNNDFFGTLISSAIKEVGKDGAISIEESKSINTELVVTNGVEFESSFASPYLISDIEKGRASLEQPFVLVTDSVVALNEQITNVLEYIIKERRSLLIIAEDFEGEALQTLIINKTKGFIDVNLVKLSSYGEIKNDILKDICILTGAQLVTLELGYSLSELPIEAMPSILGECKRVNITEDKTTIVEGRQVEAEVKARIESLENQLKETTIEAKEREIKNRIARLNGGVAVIRVGASTVLELNENKLRIEDALNATKAAVEEGIVPGGGTALFMISQILKTYPSAEESRDVRRGYSVILKALEEPFKVICENSYVSYMEKGSEIININSNNSSFNKFRRLDGSLSITYGYDALNDKICNMVDSGIIDPVKVIRSALENSVSVASSLLTTDVAITNKPR